MTTESEVSPAVRRFIIVVDRIMMVFAKHWLLLANVAMFLFVGLPVLAPVLMHYRLTGPADIIYFAYRLTCHQLAFRSFFFFGEQPVYTADQLAAATGTTNQDPMSWSGFIGNAALGYKMAWCERDAAIYLSVLLAGLVYAVIRPHLRPLDWRIFMLLLIPIAIDGFWQLFTSPIYILTFLPVHESNWWLRVLTGVLVGIGAVWLIYPNLEEAMREILAQAQGQYVRARLHHPADHDSK